MKLKSTIDPDEDLIVNEERAVRQSLFGICFSDTYYRRDNKKYEGEPLIKKEEPLGFANKNK